MPIGFVTTAASSTIPVALATVKSHLRVTSSAENDLITAYTKSAGRQVEKRAGISLLPQTFRLTMDCFPACGEIYIPIYPLTAVSSVTYRDGNGDTQTLSGSAYRVGTETGRVEIKDSWPSTDGGIEAVKVTVTAGFADAASIPEDLVNAILLTVADRFRNRGDGEGDRDLPEAAKALIDGWRTYIGSN